jgi:hypothetical protein
LQLLNVLAGPRAKGGKSFLYPRTKARCLQPRENGSPLRRKHAGQNGGEKSEQPKEHGDSMLRERLHEHNQQTNDIALETLARILEAEARLNKPG